MVLRKKIRDLTVLLSQDLLVDVRDDLAQFDSEHGHQQETDDEPASLEDDRRRAMTRDEPTQLSSSHYYMTAVCSQPRRRYSTHHTLALCMCGIYRFSSVQR